MSRIAIMTDSNSGITQSQAKELGVYVLPMPFYIDEQLFLEDITLNQEQFYNYLENDAAVSTSQPAIGDILDFWNKLLEDHDEIVYIPMSSGLSGSCSTATALAEDFDGKVQVVNNQRISVTMRYSCLEAQHLAAEGKSAAEIKEFLEETKFDSSIYIMVDTLTYLKKGGRLTPAVAAIGTLLRLKPVLQIQGEKLDAFNNARSTKHAKKVMLEAIRKDAEERFGGTDNCIFHMAYTGTDTTAIDLFQKEAMAAFPDHPAEDFHKDPLSLSISCHIGPGAIAITCTKKHF